MSRGALWSGSVIDTIGAVTSADAVGGTVVAPSATAHTKGAYAQLIAATARAYDGFFLHANWESNGGTVYPELLFDLAIGPAASEQVILPNIPVSESLFYFQSQSLFLPLYLPRGVRVAARAQQLGTTGHTELGVWLSGIASHPRNPPGYQRATHEGVSTATTRLTSITPSYGAESAWVQVTAASTHRCVQLYLLLQAGVGATAGKGASRLHLDIGIGAAAAEQVLVENIAVFGSGTGVLTQQWYGPFPVDIPAGTRLAVRAQERTSGFGAFYAGLLLLG